MLNVGIGSRPKLTNETFVLMRDLIYSRCGIYFADNKKYLIETRLGKRVEDKNLKTFEDYYYYLMYDPNREKEMIGVLNSIVTNETSFFRDPAQLEMFRKSVMPKVIERKSKGLDKTIRLWSAASSTGEEAYTLAIMLMEDGYLQKGWGLEILASDISENVLKSAANAVYDKYSIRNTPEPVLKRYFTQNGEQFALSQKVKDFVKFRRINLMDSTEIRSLRRFDVVFCRNVLIYFDDNSKKKTLGNIYDVLEKGGYLLIGFSESLHSLTRVFMPVSMDRLVVYQKI